MNKIEYTPDNLSHHKVNIYNWITHGIIINGSRYILKEFIINSNRLSAIVTNDNKNYYIIHETQMDSRNVLSNRFKMHFKSVFIYLKKHKIFGLIKIAK